MKQKFKLKDYVALVFGIVFALLVAAAVSVPIIMKLELMAAATDYLNRH